MGLAIHTVFDLSHHIPVVSCHFLLAHCDCFFSNGWNLVVVVVPSCVYQSHRLETEHAQVVGAPGVDATPQEDAHAEVDALFGRVVCSSHLDDPLTNLSPPARGRR